MQELSGGTPNADGHVPRRIEGGPSGGYDDRDVKPWHRPPPPPVSDVAPWQQRGRDFRPRGDFGPREHAGPPPWASQGRGGDNHQGYGSHAGRYGGAAMGIPPWQQPTPQMPSGPFLGYGYAGYSPYAANPPGSMGGYSMPPGMGMAIPPPPPPAEGPPPPVCDPRVPVMMRIY